MKTRRGSLILTAIFIAVFLFFLSVALVSTNRQDLQVTLLADHKRRATGASDAGLVLALQTMRNVSNWEQDLASRGRQTLDGGATFQVVCQRRPDLELELKGPGLESTPILEITSTGASGGFQVPQRMYVEEMRFGDSLVTGANRPFLFAMSADKMLLGMDPTFHWKELSPMPVAMVNDTLTGAAGPAFMATNTTAPPLQILDWSPPILQANGFYTPGSFGPVPVDLPQAYDAYQLKLDRQTFTWDPLVDPNEALGNVTQATINGRTDGAPTFATVATGAGPVSVDVSEYQGPRAEFYFITGQLAAQEGAVYAQALHVLYQGMRMKNTTTPGQGTYKPGNLYKEPAVLRYDGNNKRWSVVTDLLKVTDPLSEPEVQPGPRPGRGIRVGRGRVFCRGTDGTWLAAQDNSFVLADENKLQKRAAIVYEGQLKVTRLAELRHSLRPVPSSYQFGDLPLGRQYTGRVPLVRRPDGSILTPDRLQDWTILPDFDGTAVAGREVVTILAIQDYEDNEARRTLQVTRTICLGHFDGYRWQLWPGGLSRLETNNLVVAVHGNEKDKEPNVAVDGNCPLAFCGYPTGQPLQRRYQVIWQPPP